MRIAITDACIFIDLYQLQITPVFFQLDIEVHTSRDVINELYPEQREFYQAFELAGKLMIHNISSTDRQSIREQNYPRSLSIADQTVLHLASALHAIVLTSDKVVRQFAKHTSIEYHGMLWIFDQLVEKGLLQKPVACTKIKLLIKQNMIYQGSKDLNDEMNRRIRKWNE